MTPPPSHATRHSPLPCSQSISWLLSVPGASATVLEAAVPYARDSLVEVLGGKVG